MAIMAISIAPSSPNGESYSPYVAKAIKTIQNDPRVKWELNSMFTTIEGDMPVLFELAAKMHEALFEAGADRVGTVIKIDDRRDRKAHMEEKINAVKQHLTDK